MAKANMQTIYERLNAVEEYHPLTADTFGDWSMEAGDIVKVVRGTEEYDVPVHSSTLVWRGKQRMSIDSTGKKERDSIARASAQKYGRGGAAVRGQQGLYQHFESEDLSIRSEFAISYESLRVQFENEITSTRSEFQMTSESLRIEFENEINSTRSEFQITSESLRIEFENEINSTRSEFQMTSESLRIEFENEINSTRSEFQMTSESLRIEFENEITSTRSEFQMTSESLRIEFENEITSTRSAIQVQANRIGLVVEGTGANAHIRPAQIVAAINDDETSETLISANKVKISGTTTINDVFTVADGHVSTKVSIYAMPGTNFNGAHVGSFYFSQDEQGHSVQYGILKKALVDGNTLKIWKFGDSDSSPSITFSKATSLDGEWSGAGHLTVDATQTNSGVETEVAHYHQYLIDSGVKENNDGTAYTSGNIWYVPVNVKENPSELGTGTPTGMRVAVNATSVHVAGWNACRLEMSIPTSDIGAIPNESFTVGKPKADEAQGTDDTKYTMSVNDSFQPQGSATTIYAAEVTANNGNVVSRISIQDVFDEGYREGAGSGTITGEEIGWSNAYSKVSVPGQNVSTNSAIFKTPNSTKTSNPVQNTHNLSISDDGNNAVVINMATNSGTPVSIARYSHNKYTSGKATGWGNAYSKVSIPSSNTQTNSATFKTPNSTEDSNPAQNTHNLSITDDGNNAVVISMATDNGTPVSIARYSHNKYTSGHGQGMADEKALVRSRFNTSNNSYFIESYENTSGYPAISNTETYYKLQTTGSADSTKVIIANTSGTKINNTPEIDVGSLYTGGFDATRLSATWGTGDDANKLTINKSLSTSGTSEFPKNYYVTAGTSVTWDSSVNKFKAVPIAYCDSAARYSGSAAYSGEISIRANNMQGSGASAYRTVSIMNGTTAIYTSGHITDYGDGYSQGNTDGITTGKNAVTLTTPSWNSLTTLTSSRTVTVSTSGRPTRLDASKTVYLTAGTWGSGSIPIYIRDGSTSGTIVAQNSVSLPDVTKTEWLNTTANQWRTRLTIGGVTRYSDIKDFGTTTETYWANLTANVWRTRVTVAGKYHYSDTRDFQDVYDNGYSKGYTAGYSDGGGGSTHSISTTFNDSWNMPSSATEASAKQAAATAMGTNVNNLTRVNDGRFKNNTWFWFRVKCGSAYKYYYGKIA